MIPKNIQLASLIGGLSLAVDLAEGKPLQHARNVTYLSLYIGKTLELPKHEMDVLYFASLLHDITFTSQGNLCPLCDTVKQYGLSHLVPVLFEADHTIHNSRECWEGTGPGGLAGEQIPLSARILTLAMAVDETRQDKKNFWQWRQLLQDTLPKQMGKLFDPRLANLFLALLRDRKFCLGLFAPSREKYIEQHQPSISISNEGTMLEILGKSFALFIDQRSSYTANHSLDVANAAAILANQLGYDGDTRSSIYLAGLLHDLGKITIPKHILEKNAPLTDNEFNIVKNHPYYSNLILDRIPELDTISFWASAHHEKLDGSGYYLGSKGFDLPDEARLIAVADVYAALAADRPYRKGMAKQAIKDVMYGMAKNQQLDRSLVETLLDLLNSPTAARLQTNPLNLD